MSLLRKLPTKFLIPQSVLVTRSFTKSGAFPDEPTSAYYDDLVNAAGHERDLETVRYLLNKRARDCCFNTANTFNFITNTENSLSVLSDLCRTLARLDKGFPRKSAYDTLIARLCKLKKIDEALRVVDIMAEGGFGLSAITFHPILSVLTRGKRMEEAWGLMEVMTEIRVSPDLTAYNYLLTAYCFKGNLTATSGVLKKMEEEKLGADARTYDALVLGACRAGRVEEAFVLLRRMVDDGQSVLYSTYAHVMGALLRLGYYAQAVKFVMVCGGRDIKLDTELFGSLGSKLIGLESNAAREMELRGSHNVRGTHAATTGGGREDCWSEGATGTLIEAWGDRYVRLNRGHLRQKDWKEVAESVNSRENGVKPKKTDIQCKNRIDTLKKKYKIEKAKPPPSKWPFYYRLDSLIGNDAVSSKKPANITLRVKSKPRTSFVGRSVSTENDNLSSDGEADDDGDDDEIVVKKVHRMEDVDLSDGAACRELARAILKFGEIYERIESAKQKQMMELEKERLEFIKDVECERMNMFMGAQLEIQKSKRKQRPASSEGTKELWKDILLLSPCDSLPTIHEIQLMLRNSKYNHQLVENRYLDGNHLYTPQV
ncbi:hypothetical protein CUMW_052120 [Citrus unshiu]|nr:hypothetical protein CUMW_052120 [Citrus unshiu]